MIVPVPPRPTAGLCTKVHVHVGNEFLLRIYRIEQDFLQNPVYTVQGYVLRLP